jgi:hypothetical protein
MGSGDFTKLNIASTDAGGQLDSSEHTPEGAQMILGEGQTAASWVVSPLLPIPRLSCDRVHPTPFDVADQGRLSLGRIRFA